MHSRISKGRPVVSKVLVCSKRRKRRGWAFLYRYIYIYIYIYICRSAQISVCCLPFLQLHSYSLLSVQMSWWNGMLYKNKYRQFEKNTETQNQNTCQSPDFHIQFCRTSVKKTYWTQELKYTRNCHVKWGSWRKCNTLWGSWGPFHYNIYSTPQINMSH